MSFAVLLLAVFFSPALAALAFVIVTAWRKKLTLKALMIAVAVIGLDFTVVGAFVGAVNRGFERDKRQFALDRLNHVAFAVKEYREESWNGKQWPEKLADLVVAAKGRPTPWLGPQPRGPADPLVDFWGNPVLYEPPAKGGKEQRARVISLGADGLPGGSGPNEDIVIFVE